MASESALIKNLKQKVNQLPGARIKKLWSSHMNRDIDIIVVIYGVACFFEIKLPGQKPTSWQYNRLAWWAASGAETGWYDNVDECVAHVAGVSASFDARKNIIKATTWQRLAIEASEKG